MNAYLECYPCLARNAVDLAKRATNDPVLQKKIVSESLQFLANQPGGKTPPWFFSQINGITQKYTGNKDLYQEEKNKSNRLAQQLVQNLQEIPEFHPDEFESRLRMAVAGNIIDFGIFSDLNIEQAIQAVRDSFRKPLPMDAVRLLKEKIDSAKTILYLLDNNGEAVFDRIFIEPFKEKVILGVRESNVLNDVTEEDLPACGLHNFTAGVIKNGTPGIPGTDIQTANREFLETFRSADLIIAKGQGNFETLNESDAPIAFLFMAKCPVVAQLLNVKLKTIQVRTINF